jgi:cytosine/adenosine deaminase-related metal-dependent hydrolase
MLLRAPWVVTRSLQLRRNGVVDAGGKAGKLVLEDSILMPGLINAHCHLDFTALRGRIPPPSSFTAWVEQVREVKFSWTPRDFVRSIRWGMEESLRYGTTALVNLVSSPTTIPAATRVCARTWWLWEQLGARTTDRSGEWDGWRGRIRGRSPLWEGGLAPHAPFSCRPQIIAEAERWCRRHRLPWTIHVAESREEYEMFRHARGPLFELCRRLGRDMRDCGRTTPLQALRPVLAHVRMPVLLVHANTLDRSDLRWLGSLSPAARRKLHVVHCPRSHAYFRHPPFPLQALRDLGLNLCLGTDSLASNENLSMFEEMGSLARQCPEISPWEIVVMATRNGARALGQDGAWRRWQDWTAIPATVTRPEEVWQAICSFTGKPRFTMVDGRILAST